MKRKASNNDTEESKLSHLLFNKTKSLVDKLKSDDCKDAIGDQKPVWFDDDDIDYNAKIIPHVKSKALYSEQLKQKYETLMGTPNWAKLDKKIKTEDVQDDILRTVGHIKKQRSTSLGKDFIEFKRFPKINSETSNEGPIISCIEFHPKLSVAMVAGQSGVVSLFSIGGDTNNKLHSFKLKKWKIKSAQFTPDGSEAYISTDLNHSYCVYDLIKAQPKLIQLPQYAKKPKLFKLSPDGKLIATSCGLDEVFIICAKSKELLRSLKHNSNVESIAFSPNSDEFYCYCIDGNVTVWNLSTYRSLKKFYDHGCVTASTLTVSPCGRLLATGSGQGIVNVYETSNLSTADPLPLKTISNLTTKITTLKFNCTSEILAMSSGYYPNAVKLVQLPSYHVFYNFPKQSSNLFQVDTVSFSPNSGYMALGNNKGCAYLYRLKHYKNY